MSFIAYYQQYLYYFKCCNNTTMLNIIAKYLAFTSYLRAIRINITHYLNINKKENNENN